MSLKSEVLAVLNYHISNQETHLEWIEENGDYPACINEMLAIKAQITLAEGVVERVNARERL